MVRLNLLYKFMDKTLEDTDILILSGSRETKQKHKNEMFDIQDKKDKPLIFIRKKQKYAYVEVDFITCYPKTLTRSAYKKSLKVMDKYWRIGSNNIDNNKSIQLSSGKGLISLKNLTIPQARLYAKELEQIVMNERNLTESENYDYEEVHKEVEFFNP